MNDNNERAFRELASRTPVGRSRAIAHLQRYIPFYVLLTASALVGGLGWKVGGSSFAWQKSGSCQERNCENFLVSQYGRELTPKSDKPDGPQVRIYRLAPIMSASQVTAVAESLPAQSFGQVNSPPTMHPLEAKATIQPNRDSNSLISTTVSTTGLADVEIGKFIQQQMCMDTPCESSESFTVPEASLAEVVTPETRLLPLEVKKTPHRERAAAFSVARKPIRKTKVQVQKNDDSCNDSDCVAKVRGKVLDDSSAQVAITGKNTEQENPGDEGDLPFSISVDGEPLAGAETSVDAQRQADLGLVAVDIQVKFDGLDVKPILSVSINPPIRTYHAGETIQFHASWNYPDWIKSAEIRIFENTEEGRGELLSTVPVSPVREGVWTVPSEGGSEFIYVLRVYDDAGRFDETLPLTFIRTSDKVQPAENNSQAGAPGFGEDRTAFRNIPVYGGAVTVYGKNVPSGHNVIVFGETVPVDDENSFVIQRILPPGDHNIGVNVEDQSGQGLAFNREVNIPTSEWFYVALADLTVGRKFTSNKIVKADTDEFDKVYTKGRLAYYLKGKIKGRYLLTSAVDTGEDDIENLFKGLDAKDPRQFLRRLDPDDYYPVYGDDSVTVEDAPTRGKFYVRLERGDSSVMWGNFNARINGTEFLRNERALYGAHAVYRSEKTVSAGERQTETSVYAAQPGTLPQRDVLRGTGGSAYFLKHQDITIGSETVTVEIRDDISGRVLERRLLRYDFDYDIDYIQGVILLRKPLSSTVGSGDVVRNGALDGEQAYLIVNYEYTPASGEADGYVYGGRGQQWLGDKVRVGVTAMSEKTGPANQRLYGADVLVRHSDSTYIEAEIAQSKGPGFGHSTSADGGLTITDSGIIGSPGGKANAYRVEGHVGLQDITNGQVEGDVEAYLDKKESGFSSLASQSNQGERIWGANAHVKLTDRLGTDLSYDERKLTDGRLDRTANAQAEVQLNHHWIISPGVKHLERKAPLEDRSRQGKRTDIGAKLAYRWNENNVVFVFGQATVDRSGGRRAGDRVGVGGKKQFTEKISAEAELSEGVGGVGGLASIDYAPTADNHYYLGYRLDPDRWDSLDQPYVLDGEDLGVIVAGAKHGLSETLSAYAEDNYDMFGNRKSLTQTYGVNYTPTERWTFSGGVEIGSIFDETINNTIGLKNEDFDRTAISLSAAYRNEDRVSASLRGEARFEESDDNTRDRNTYLVGANLGYGVLDDWRLIASVDAVVSDAGSETIRDGEYVEGSFGYAYRPVSNDRLNALFKYTFLYDLPGPDQVNFDGTTLGPKQRSNILSADASYDLNELITIGGKYGFRVGETKPREGGDWEEGSAHLGILRTDLHIVHNWDVLVEGRALWTPEGDDVSLGALAAVYRHFGENFKLGAGYNFGRFSDDLRDLTYDDHGVFVNAIGKL